MRHTQEGTFEARKRDWEHEDGKRKKHLIFPVKVFKNENIADVVFNAMEN